jgi:hypothetical protein
LFVVLIGFTLSLNINAQDIKISASNESLNQVLIEIRDKYDVEFSFNDAELSKYKVNISKSFASIEKTLEYLLSNTPFEFEKNSGVYIIFPKKNEPEIIKEKPKVFSIAGRIIEAKSNEFLPYTFLQVNSFGILSDQNGSFQFSTTKDSIFNIKISNLGYLIKDTVLYAGNKNVKIYLSPEEQIIKEIVVNENLIETFMNAGNEVATIKLNHKVAKYLPGSSDNSVFNLLRLQPGVLAAGEQTNDLTIWGSYAGQSRVIFDGFTIFGLKNFNDNISTINPLIVKNIQLKKAGYDASYGDCVGGIVEVSGKDGNMQKPHFELGINNFTLNSLLEIPVLKISSLQLAYRQTYYNLYSNGLNLFPRKTSNENLANIYIYPDYTFMDYNIKYTVKTDKNLFYISFLNSRDKFEYSINKTRQYREIEKSTTENDHQSGGAIFMETKLGSRFKSNLCISYSDLTGELNDNYNIISTITGRLVNQKAFYSNNEIQEIKAELQNTYQTTKNQVFEVNLQAINNMSNLVKDSAGISLTNTENNNTYYTIGFKDIIGLTNKNFNFGFRVSYLPYLNKTFFEPRISFSHNIGSKFKYNLAWGIYRQYVVKSSAVDELENYQYFWNIANNNNIPVLKSYHYVAGFSFCNRAISCNIDAFYKTTEGLTRYIKILQQEMIYKGDGKSYGFDFYTKYNFRKHTIWLSYTLSKTLEHFSYFKSNDYLYAPQDHRHEIKLASIINLSPFFLSANYVYGSGFLEKPYRQTNSDNRISYNRMDISASFKFTKKKNIGECGISILNVLNTKNQKYSNFEKIPISQTSSVDIYFEAVPFTPTLFLKLTI